ncbi:AUGMIN subunit 8-like isoform X1 [Gossypium arboreum]|uniref:AUGMIN subunit 8-like isoform X1 n=1 Tax=Gossypium arboreum TaxID=29729 RepID=UPI0022F1938F|nr:AUGMIN subunit 8-like isoform X1 [Gossypium arboreum]XP_017613227.2 AUGMIN subunit 8-like isoform X1 [Gossypium arboreum]XP_052882480.1 AUGMIN subunit 8-like isoform X1 [Gossypium arboreum]
MDGCKSEQRLWKLAAVVDTIRPPLVPAEKNNAVFTTSHPPTKEVSSSYEVPTPPTSSVPRRFPSPNLTRTSPTPFQVVQKRAVSAERKRPSTPPSHENPSTPVHDSSKSMPSSSRRLSADRIPESLWPSTMRSHSVSFQSDDISIPLSQKEKEKSGSNVSLDRTLKPPSNVAHKQQSETSTLSRKPSPERKRNLLDGKNAADQSENAKPVDDLPSRLIDHHRWPSRIGGKLSSNSLNKSVDLGDKIVKNLSTPVPGAVSSLKRMPMSNNLGKPLQKTSGDTARLLSHEEIGRVGSEAILINDKPLRATVPTGILCASSLEKSTVANSGSRSQSPSRTSVSRGISPYPAGPSSPPSRGVSPTPRGVSLPPREVSPTQIRTSIPSSQSQNSTSVLSSTSRGVSPTPRVVSPTWMRTSSLSSQSHSSTSVISSTSRGVSPTRMRASTLSSQSHSSAPVVSSTLREVSLTPRVISPTRMRKSTSLSLSHSSTSISSTPRGVNPTPSVVSPTQIRTYTSSSQSHSSTSVISSTPRGVIPTPRVVSPTGMRTSTSSSQSHSSTSVHISTLRGVSPISRVVSPIRIRTSSISSQSHSLTSVIGSTPKVVSPTRMGTSTSSSQSHSSTSVISSTPRGVSPTPNVIISIPRGVSPTPIRTSTSSSQSHSSTSVISSTPRGFSPTPRVVSPTRMRTSTSSSQSHSSTSVISSTPRGASPTPRVVSPTQMRTSISSSQSHSSTSVTSPTPMVASPTQMRTSTSSSQSHSSTSVTSPTPMVASPTQIRTSTSSNQSHSSTSVISSTPRGVSPTPRVVSPTRMRTSTSSSQSHSSTPDISFITDFQKVRKSASFIEDAHQLHLLYNRYLQWRYANAHSEAVLYIQKVNAKETAYNVWNATLGLWDALIKKRINLQRLKSELKLNSILNDQIGYLKDWVLLERDHIRCLAGAVEDLKATTLHLPVTDGGRADSESLKAAICSVVDVMQAMGSSICSLVPKVEGVNNWVSELAAISAQEQNMLDQCEALLASTADLQLEEYSLRSHLIQTKQPSKKNKQPVLGTKTFPWP